jgi:hypothetical protein
VPPARAFSHPTIGAASPPAWIWRVVQVSGVWIAGLSDTLPYRHPIRLGTDRCWSATSTLPEGSDETLTGIGAANWRALFQNARPFQNGAGGSAGKWASRGDPARPLRHTGDAFRCDPPPTGPHASGTWRSRRVGEADSARGFRSEKGERSNQQGAARPYGDSSAWIVHKEGFVEPARYQWTWPSPWTALKPSLWRRNAGTAPSRPLRFRPVAGT